jgi:hypothetical protein
MCSREHASCAVLKRLLAQFCLRVCSSVMHLGVEFSPNSRPAPEDGSWPISAKHVHSLVVGAASWSRSAILRKLVALVTHFACGPRRPDTPRLASCSQCPAVPCRHLRRALIFPESERPPGTWTCCGGHDAPPYGSATQAGRPTPGAGPSRHAGPSHRGLSADHTILWLSNAIASALRRECSRRSRDQLKRLRFRTRCYTGGRKGLSPKRPACPSKSTRRTPRRRRTRLPTPQRLSLLAPRAAPQLACAQSRVDDTQAHSRAPPRPHPQPMQRRPPSRPRVFPQAWSRYALATISTPRQTRPFHRRPR